ncbi:MAG: site-2 protease family protein [Planctomycetota bacterium]|nr:site-2 protease family protein [Planctomycetota bacterium]
MCSTLKLGRIFGIETYIHWSFWILLLWIVLQALGQGGLAAAVSATGFVMAIFFCVYLHELGHAMTARQYGIQTLDISILPIGGLARLERMPKSPIAEFWIAIAGPAVNVVIALVLASLFGIKVVIANMQNADILSHSLLLQLVAINVSLAVFNMFPALPMDGGRILRSLLQLRMSRLRATEVAARVSRYLAGVLIIAGFIYGFHLVLIGVFVLIAGFQELMMARVEHLREQGMQSPGGSVYQDVPMSSGYQSWPPESFGGRQQRPPVDGEGDVLDATEVRRIP